jgi:hypothetical protein
VGSSQNKFHFPTSNLLSGFDAKGIDKVKRMRSFLINKNLSLYYWLKKRIGKRRAFRLVNAIEKVLLIFGRDQVEDRKC